MLLENKTAIVYGAGGMIGAAVGRTFAREGANVYLAGRTRAPLDAVAAEIDAAGGTAQTAQVDALDERAVGAHASSVADAAGSIDVTFNAISLGDVQGTPLARDATRGLPPPDHGGNDHSPPDGEGCGATNGRARVRRGPHPLGVRSSHR